MKANTIKRSNHTGLVLMTAAVALVALAVGAVFCYDRLKSVCEEECVILDMSAQVRIETGKMIPAETIAAELGLKKGANLAEIVAGSNGKVKVANAGDKLKRYALTVIEADGKKTLALVYDHPAGIVIYLK